jgi:hypothetical protein
MRPGASCDLLRTMLLSSGSSNPQLTILFYQGKGGGGTVGGGEGVLQRFPSIYAILIKCTKIDLLLRNPCLREFPHASAIAFILDMSNFVPQYAGCST